jgi:chromate reductase
MRVSIIAGSPRKSSNTLRVAKAIANEFSRAHGITPRLVDFAYYDIPLMAQGEITAASILTPFQKELIEAMDDADLVFILSPEYNWMPSAEIINMVHQLATNDFRRIFENKVYAMAGVSNGRGGKIPAIQLSYVINKLLNVFHTETSFVSAKTFESQFTHDVLDENGNSMGNAVYDKGLQAFVTYAVNVSRRWFGVKG